MYKSTISVAMLQVLYHQGLAVGTPDLGQLEAASGPVSISFDGPVLGDINITIEGDYTGGGGCCDHDNDDHDNGDNDNDHDHEETGGDGDNGTGGDDGEGAVDQCDYIADAPQNEFKDLAETLDWDVHGFITDWNWEEPQDVRITPEFIVYIYDNICCPHLNESIDMMLSRGGFYFPELLAYQEDERQDLTGEVLDAQAAALGRCDAAGQGWEAHDAQRRADAVPVDACDHWTDAWFDVKPAEQELAEELNWDTTGFITDYINFDSQDTRIDEDFMIYTFGAACCRELNESIDMLLTSNGWYFRELMDYMQDNQAALGPSVIQAASEALDRCEADGQGWAAHDDAMRAERQFAVVDACDHWAYAWHATKSDEQELAEDLGWDVAGFATDFYHGDAGQDPGIDDDFMAYIYGAACCSQLQEVRDLLLGSQSGLTVQQLRLQEESVYSLEVYNATEAAYERCGIAH